MCHKRCIKIKRGSIVMRLREARRLHRLLRSTATRPRALATETLPTEPCIDKEAQNRLISELTDRTASIMEKNTIIQQKILDLQKETSEHVASVLKHPENQRRYVEHLRRYGMPNYIGAYIPLVVDNRLFPYKPIPIRLAPNQPIILK